MRQKDLSRAISKLIEVGFTEYQAKAYAGLLTVSSAKATDLSKIITVPKAKIYQILGELLEMGTIRKKQTRPVAYSALPPEKALSNMLAWKGQQNQRQLEIMEELSTETIPALEKVSKEPRPLSKTQFLEIIPVGDISEVETKSLINSAKMEIRIMSGTFEYLPQLEDELESAKKRGVSIKVLLKKPGNPHAKKVQAEVTKILKSLKIEYKHIAEMPLRGTIADSSQVIFSVDESRVLPVLKEIAISRNRNMAKALNTYFDFMWKSG